MPDFSFPVENFLRNSSVVLYQCSLEEDYPIVHISENVKRILGYAPSDAYKDSMFWLKKIHHNDRAKVEESFFDILNHKKSTYIYRFCHKEGHYLWLRDENMVSYNASGKPVAITGTAIDISPQKKAEEEVKKLNENLEQRIDQRTQNLLAANQKLKKQIKYRNKAEKQMSDQQKMLKLLEAGINRINDILIISKAPVDNPLDSEIILTNHAFERITGYNSDEVIGQNPSFLHGEKTQKDKLRRLNRRIKHHKPSRIEFINYKKDGTSFWIDLELSPFLVDEHGMEYWIGVNRDITERKQTEQALAENEERYRAYTELSFDAIFELTENGRILDCNVRACQLFGYEKEELVAMNINDLMLYSTKKSKKTSLIQAEKNDDINQRIFQKKDGTTFTSEVNTKPYHHNGDDHIIAYVRDISDHISYEETIKKSLREKSTLLAEVHHRVKNNLAIISGLLEMQAFNAIEDKVVSELKESQSRIQSIATVHELLYQSESFSDIKLGPYVDELVSYISETLGSDKTKIQIEENIKDISLNVKQAVPCGLLLNELITNAYRHAFRGRSEGTIFIELQQEGRTVHLHLRDDGIGLPEDFKTRKFSSLGLSLIHTLVQQLEGQIAIERSPMTSFYIKFKIQD